MAKKLFGGKETYSEELKEAKAVKSGKISPEGFAKGERSEGHKDEEKNPLKLGKEIKSGKVSPTQYAKMEAKEPKGMCKGGKAYAKGGSVSSASKRADGCAIRGKTKGTFV